MKKRDRIAIAIGDPNGIGPELAVKAALSFIGGDLQPVIVGDAFVIQEYARRHAAGIALRLLAETDGGAEDAIAYFPVDALAPGAFNPGRIDPAAGRATVAYVREAVRLAQAGVVKAIVGCPHSETAINSAGIAFSGYPQLIAQLTGTPDNKVFLMLAAAGLRIAHVTLHESVQHALGRMTTDLVVEAGVAAVEACRRLGLDNPTLGVFGINPHAGENGLFGDEDERITRPAVQRLRAFGIAADGPVGADLFLGQRRHDVYLAMFHDQGHIPIKLLSPLRASALTIGAGILFSSVGHGSAFDIAGRGIADPVAVIETLALLHAVRN
ncbi:MAG: terephthalate dihydrodiol dehydrogenase [Herbaspirillum sp.]|jgi:4-hydroxy-L-threonine phosphate dehydrogenase PdxA|nr:terephthalate dihydrodiol dehydrogenase [Herbaspirillum sp.]